MRRGIGCVTEGGSSSEEPNEWLLHGKARGVALEEGGKKRGKKRGKKGESESVC